MPDRFLAEEDLHRLLMAPRAEGIEIPTKEESKQVRAARLNHGARQERETHTASHIPPTEFGQCLEAALEAQTRSQETGESAALDEAIAAWSRMLEHEALPSEPLDSQLSALNGGGRLFLSRYWMGGNVDDLNRALDLWRQAIKIIPRDSSILASILTNLGTGLLDRFALTKYETDLEDAISALEGAVSATPPDSPFLARRLSNLGRGLDGRYRHRRLRADLEEVIRLYRQAVEMSPPDSPHLPKLLGNLASALREKFEDFEREMDLDEPIWLLAQAVQMTQSDSPDLAVFVGNLADILRDRFWQTGVGADLDEAIRLYRWTMESTSPAPSSLLRRLSQLGNGLRDRFLYRGSMVDLAEATQLFRRAVESSPSDSPDLHMYLANLGNSLHNQFEQTASEENLEHAINLLQRSLSLTPPDSHTLPIYQTNLGNVLRDRFTYEGQEVDLENAIGLFQQAVHLTRLGSTELPLRLTCLGNGLRDRFHRTGLEADLQEAIRHYRQAADLSPPTSPDLAMFLTNLGNALCDRFLQFRDDADLEEAILLFRRAVDVDSPGSPSLPIYLTNLGSGLLDQFRHNRHEASLEEAISALQDAVNRSPQNSPFLPRRLTNLGAALTALFGRTGEEVDREKAIRAYRDAIKLGAVSEPLAALDSADGWGGLAFGRHEWGQAAEAFGHGLAIGRKLVGSQLRREHKHNSLHGLQGMSASAAYALAKLGRYEDAVVIMERGRARLLGEALQRSRRDLEQLPARGHEKLYQRFLEIVEIQERLTQPAETTGSGRPDRLSDSARLEAVIAANTAFAQVVVQIQQVPGYADFLAEPSFDQIQTAALDVQLVYLLATSAGGLALIVNQGGVQPMWLDGLTDTAVREWLSGHEDHLEMSGWLGAYQDWLRERTQRTQGVWFEAIDEVTRKLWTYIMEPLATTLRQLSVEPLSASWVTLVPAGLLALLPLHAAWSEDSLTPTGRRYFLDDFTVNYAPSAMALRSAREAAGRPPAGRMLGVEDPSVATASRLPSAHSEVTTIAELFDNPVILARERATRQAVLAALPNAHVVHFSCHGSNDWQSPLNSGLVMADDEMGERVYLMVRDLLDLKHAGGRLASLSACETGIVGINIPDEVVALPSSLIEAGFGGVAASLWSVADISTAVLMVRFYRFWRKDDLAPACALRAAQRWLRDTTNQEKAEYFKKYNDEVSGTRTHEGAAVNLISQFMSRDPDLRDFAHPFWWAAFYLTGV
jgi:CHAT domain-containing protein/tetratricopeptide (TPR) repeat protein